MFGDALYAGWPSYGSVTRARTQPARCLAMSDVTWSRGTWITTSPSRLSPPVVSQSSSQGAQLSPSQASQASGGLGEVDADALDVAAEARRTAFDGTASDSPT